MTDHDEELVSEEFSISELDLEELAEENDYWASALDFYMSVKSKTVSSLSSKKRQWLLKIEDDLASLNRRGRLR